MLNGDFAAELESVLPPDLPRREVVVAKSARHLEMTADANRTMNLTRIVDPREAAIKHVLDSVLPWRRFAHANRVLDAGTGAGFPGLPLALVLPDVQFVLSESIQKKARFVQAVVNWLALPNVTVAAARAEDYLKTNPVTWVTARAVAPVSKAVDLFGAAITRGARCLLYKGPDADQEIAEAAPRLQRSRIQATVVARYDLPGECGTRTLVELKRHG
jgi:16S rRNA (guanine527-N7)-methyltransferase